MKLAFHFNADSVNLGNYGDFFESLLLKAVRQAPDLPISTKVFVGDLLLYRFATSTKKTGEGETETFHRDRYVQVVDKWLEDQPAQKRRVAYARDD